MGASATQLQEAGASLSEEERSAVLSLRGMLACHILEHSLQMRHLVDYGVNRCACQVTRLCCWIKYAAKYVAKHSMLVML